jgi:hypothetical protein
MTNHRKAVLGGVVGLVAGLMISVMPAKLAYGGTTVDESAPAVAGDCSSGKKCGDTCCNNKTDKCCKGSCIGERDKC